MVVELLGQNKRIADNAVAALLGFGEVCLEVALVSVENVAGTKNRIEFSVNVEAYSLAASAGVPIANAVGVYLTCAADHTESRCELVAVAAVVDAVHARVIPESTALLEHLIVEQVAAEGVERMDILHLYLVLK